jgi:hypothetical protein
VFVIELAYPLRRQGMQGWDEGVVIGVNIPDADTCFQGQVAFYLRTSGLFTTSLPVPFRVSASAAAVIAWTRASGSSPRKAGSTCRGIGAGEQRERPKANARQLVRHRTDVRAGPA